MNRRWGFWAAFLGGPASGLMSAFALGVLVVSLLSDLCYDLLAGAPVQRQTVIQTLVISGVMTIIAYVLYRRTQGRVSMGIAVDESQLAPARAGLIWLLGPNYDHLLTALRHHCQGGGGAHCWLVLQDSPAMQDTFQRCAAAVVAAELTTRLYPVYLRRLDAQSASRGAGGFGTRGGRSRADHGRRHCRYHQRHQTVDGGDGVSSVDLRRYVGVRAEPAGCGRPGHRRDPAGGAVRYGFLLDRCVNGVGKRGLQSRVHRLRGCVLRIT